VKILQVYKDIHPEVRGGIERYVYDLGTFLASRGHDSGALVAGRRGADSPGEIDGIRIMRARCLGRILSNPVCPGLGRLIAASGADILHFHLPLPSAVLGWLWNGAYGSRPYVVTYHSDIVRQAFLMPLYGPFLKRFLAGADRIFATSDVYAETSPWIRGLPSVRVIPIGTDLSRWGRKEPGERGGYFLFVGRFRRYKGIDVLLDAWSGLDDLELVMVGGGPLLPEVAARVRSEGLRVRILTDLPDEDLVSLYRGARALVLPSTQRSEAFGMVQVEAMASATPVISTDIPTGVPWVNADGVSGIVVQAGSPEAIAAAARRMMDDSVWDVLSNGAVERARTLFDGPSLLEEVERNYSEVLSGWRCVEGS
jgi:rhamnosyl/mannosyltransferase